MKNIIYLGEDSNSYGEYQNLIVSTAKDNLITYIKFDIKDDFDSLLSYKKNHIGILSKYNETEGVLFHNIEGNIYQFFSKNIILIYTLKVFINISHS